MNPIPVEHVLRKNGDILIVVNLYGEKKVDIPKEINTDDRYLNKLLTPLLNVISTGDKSSKGYYSLLGSASSAMIHKIAIMSIEKPDMIINIPYDSASTFDFFKANELIESGEKRAAETIHNFFNKTSTQIS